MKHFKGTLALARVALRRDRIQLPVWVLAIAGLFGAAVSAWSGFLTTDQEIIAATQLYIVNPVMRLFSLASGPTVGEYAMTRGYAMFALGPALMSVFAVMRHTRQNEDTGRAEFVGSAVVGRHAGLAAALIVTLGANVVLAVLIAFALMLNGLPTTGAFAAGVAFGGAGAAFAGVAAVTAQIYSTSRAATGLATAVLGVVFLLSGVGNMLGRADEAALRVYSAWPSWLSPIGWGQQMRPFAENHWWISGLYAAFFLVLAAGAVFLATRRDVGAGLLPESRGPAVAARSLLSPVGLVWRLQRGVFLGWAAGVALFAFVFGAISGEIETMLAEMEGAADLIARLGGTDVLTDAYFAMVIGIIGIVVTIYTVQVLLRMRGEEGEGPLESVLATAVSRRHWMTSYIVNAVVGTAALLVLAGLVTGLSAGLVLGNTAAWVSDLLVAGAVQIPATLAVAGVAIAAFGLLPMRAGLVAWGAFVIAFVTGPVLGRLLELPQTVQNISPFTHTPLAPAVAVEALPIVVLLAIAVGLAAAGLAAFRRRDLALQAG